VNALFLVLSPKGASFRLRRSVSDRAQSLRPGPGEDRSASLRSTSLAPRDLTRRKAAWCVAVLVIFALSIRLVGIGHSLPHAAHADERVWAGQVAQLRGTSDALDANHARFYPNLVPWLSALVTGRVEAPIGGDPEEHRAAASREVLRLRVLGMLISLLLIPASYRIARIFLSRRAAVFAAALAASSAMLHWYSQQARPHAAAAALVAVALCLLVAARRRPTLLRWIGAGIASAAALATLQSAAALVPALLVAAVLANTGPSSGLRRWLGPAACALAMTLALPFQAALAPRAGTDALTSDAAAPLLVLSGNRVYTESFDGGGFALLFSRASQIDPLIVALCIAGIVLLAVQRPRVRINGAKTRDALVLAAHAVPYALMIGLYSRSYDRFLLPLLPVAATVAAGAVFGWSLVPRARALVPALILVTAQGAYAARISIWRATPDTVQLAARWIEEHVRPEDGSIATLPYVDVPVLRQRASLAADDRQRWSTNIVWQRYLERLPEREIEPRGYDLAALPIPTESAERRDTLLDPRTFVAEIPARFVLVTRVEHTPFVETLQAQIAESGTLVARISPYGGKETDPPAVWTGSPGPLMQPLWARTLVRTHSPGPIVEIWRLEEAAPPVLTQSE
jgi:hypothetical protein